MRFVFYKLIQKQHTQCTLSGGKFPVVGRSRTVSYYCLSRDIYLVYNL